MVDHLQAFTNKEGNASPKWRSRTITIRGVNNFWAF
jgi:hypothetical protein